MGQYGYTVQSYKSSEKILYMCIDTHPPTHTHPHTTHTTHHTHTHRTHQFLAMVTLSGFLESVHK